MGRVVKKGKKVHIKRFYEPVFRSELVFALGGDIDDVPGEIDRRQKISGTERWINSDSRLEGVCIFTTEGTGLIYFRTTDPDAGDIAHEITHFVTKRFELIGAKLVSEVSDEFYAYYHGYWMGKLVTYIKSINP